MKYHPLLLAVLLLAFTGCSRKEPLPEEDPNATNAPPESVTGGSRPGPGQLGGTDPAPPLETLDTTKAASEPEVRVPSPIPHTGDATTQPPGETAPANPSGYFLSYTARRLDTGTFDSYRFEPGKGDTARCRFDKNFDLLSCSAQVGGSKKSGDTRGVSFSIDGWHDGQSSYLYPWRSYHPRYFRNTPEQTSTPFAVLFTYVLPDGGGTVMGMTRVYADRNAGAVYANEECSECILTVHVDRAQQTVRGEFSCARLWTYPHTDQPMPEEDGPISISGEFYLPYGLH